jgi:peptidoglycan/xylan/chitin deacetylase (PgdA/CDA1 family)
VEEETGEKSTIMRFPGGSSNTINENYTSDGQNIMPTLIEDVENMGYEYYDWNVDSQDASGNNVSVSVIVSNATSSDESYVNILMHDSGSKSTTVEALPKIIKYYKKKGYVFLPITKGSYVVHHQGVVDEASDDTGTTDTSTDTGTDEETAAAQ